MGYNVSMCVGKAAGMATQIKNTGKESVPNYWQTLQLIIVVISILAILLSLIFSATEIASPHIPLWVAIITGGIPSVCYIFLRVAKGDLGADTLAVIALITAVVLQQYLAAVLIILMLSSGQTFESFAMRRASSVLQKLAERMPATVHKLVNGNIHEVPLPEIAVNDDVVIYPHETCPVDGVVMDGRGTMDESYLTGEPYQISKIKGAVVLSGAINGGSVLTVRVTRLPSDSRYASIVAVLQEAEQRRPHLRRLGDQIGAIFAPLSLAFAGLVWYVTGDAVRFLAVLVIATPCPLLIAIPITLIGAISLAARKSIIIKDPTVLERLPTCTTAIFDKTGTLTYGMPALTNIIAAEGVSGSDVLQYAASLERYSKHPLSAAILQAAKERHLPLLDTDSVSEEPGKGLSGIIGKNTIEVTHRKKFLAAHPEMVNVIPPVAAGLECIVLCNGQYAALMQFRDMPRQDSKSFIQHLMPMHRFNKVMLVSGDRESEVNYLAGMMEITEIYASQTPEQKLAIVREECKKAATLFMGDGINDAPALTAATVGVAFGEFSNVTAAAAGAVIMENSLQKVDELIHLSMAVRRIALQSAIGGMLLSLIGMWFAAGGFITPVAGAVLQEVIDVAAIINALRLIWGEKVEADYSRMDE